MKVYNKEMQNTMRNGPLKPVEVGSDSSEAWIVYKLIMCLLDMAFSNFELSP